MKRKWWLASLVCIAALAIPFGCLWADEKTNSDGIDKSEISSSIAEDVAVEGIQNIKVNTDVKGVYSGETILYRFTIDAPGKVVVNFKHDWWQDHSGDFYVFSLLSADGSSGISGGKINRYNVSGQDMDVSSHAIGLSKGTYCVKVEAGYFYNDCNYNTFTLRVNYTKSFVWEQENNDTYKKANPISINKDYYGSTFEDGDEDFFKFTLNAPGKICVEFEHEDVTEDLNDKFWQLAFYEADGITPLVSDDFVSEIHGHGTGESTLVFGLNKGTYYLKIYHYWWSASTYRFKISYAQTSEWEQEPNESKERAQSIVCNKKFYGRTVTRFDVDWYELTIPESKNVEISFTHPITTSDNPVWLLTLFAADGEKVVDEWTISQGSPLTVEKKLKGQYFIRIKAYDSSSYSGFWENSIYNLTIMEKTNTPTKKATVTPKPTKAPVFSDFVERLYTCALNRKSEAAGKKFWTDEVTSGSRTGGDCARYFLLEATEFMNRGLSVDEFVETLYKTFFDRDSEPKGKSFWVTSIESGKMSCAEVVENFIESTEWCNICAKYSVKTGAKSHKATVASSNAVSFATRLYTCCLGRAPEEKGLNYWSLALTNLEQTGCSAAREFFTSAEFKGFKTSDQEYVKRLYTTFMDREPASSEVSYWTGEIAKGTQTRASVLAFFGQSEEFTAICKKYGIDRGEI